MNSKEFSALCARINAALDVREYIQMLDYHPDKAIQVAGLWRLYCPVHQERVFRTLVINPRRNTYFCEHTACAAHQPGDLIELLIKVRQAPRAQIVIELIERFGSKNLRITEQQEELLRGYATSIRPQTGESLLDD